MGTRWISIQLPEKTGDYIVEAFTMLGERLLTSTGTGNIQLDMTSFPNGMYLLTCSGNEGTASQRVVKQ